MHLLKNLFNNKEKKVTRKKKDYIILKKQFLSKLSRSLKNKNQLIFIDAIKEFFSELFHIKYEFTLGELAKIASSKKMSRGTRLKLQSTINDIEEAFYSSERIEKPKLKEFQARLKEIAKDL